MTLQLETDMRPRCWHTSWHSRERRHLQVSHDDIDRPEKQQKLKNNHSFIIIVIINSA